MLFSRLNVTFTWRPYLWVLTLMLNYYIYTAIILITGDKKSVVSPNLSFLRSISFAKFLIESITFFISLVDHSVIIALISSLVHQRFMMFTILTHLTRFWYFTLKKFMVFMRFFHKCGVFWRDFPLPLLLAPLRQLTTLHPLISCAFTSIVFFDAIYPFLTFSDMI